MSQDTLKFDAHFTVLPNEIVRDTRLSIEARGFLALMISMDENWKFYRGKMMQLSGCKRTKYDRILAELKDIGYLTITDNRKKDGTFGGRTWHIHNIQGQPCVENLQTVDQPCAVLPQAVNPAGGETCTHKNTNLNKNTNLQEIKTKQKDLVFEFEDIWLHYRKLKDADKKGALAAYRVARKKCSYSEIIKPLGEYMRHRTGQDPRYTVHLKRWFTKERWNDNQAHAANATQSSDDQLDGLMSQTSDMQLNNIFPERKAIAQ